LRKKPPADQQNRQKPAQIKTPKSTRSHTHKGEAHHAREEEE
jgi:hypothetical protein